MALKSNKAYKNKGAVKKMIFYFFTAPFSFQNDRKYINYIFLKLTVETIKYEQIHIKDIGIITDIVF